MKIKIWDKEYFIHYGHATSIFDYAYFYSIEHYSKTTESARPSIYYTRFEWEHVPTWVKFLALEEQKAQGNRADPTVFVEDIKADAPMGGFDWDNSYYGYSFWSEAFCGIFTIPNNIYTKLSKFTPEQLRELSRYLVLKHQTKGYIYFLEGLKYLEHSIIRYDPEKLGSNVPPQIMLLALWLVRGDEINYLNCSEVEIEKDLIKIADDSAFKLQY